MEGIFHNEPILSNDAVVMGVLLLMLAFIFKTSSSDQPGWKKFYKFLPMILLCYFLPSLLNTFGIISAKWLEFEPVLAALSNLGHNVSDIITMTELEHFVELNAIEYSILKPYVHESQLYFVASRYLLPSSLVLLTISVDLKEIFKLGPKALIMFFTATVGVIIGGPLAILITSSFAPDIVGGMGPEAVWRGMTTVAGSWIGGGANQAAMYEIFQPSDPLYSVMITVDVIVAEIWMFFLLIGVGKSAEIDKYFKADASSINTLQKKMEDFSLRIAKIPSAADLMLILGVCFGVTAFSHWGADIIAPFVEANAPDLKKYSLDSKFFWLIVIATAGGIILSFTKAKKLEGAGASKIGSIFIFILVATIGMKMDIMAIASNPGLFMVGGFWMAIHVGLLFIVGKLVKAPYFFLAVGSKANIGGAASAPVVAAAFHPSLAPVGVLLAVLGYIFGTYGAWLCGILMQAAAQ